MPSCSRRPDECKASPFADRLADNNEVQFQQYHQQQESFPVMQARRNPIDLSARMAVCDANYIRILKLLPGFSASAARAFDLPAVGVGADKDTTQRVVLEVVESFKYTSTVSIRLDPREPRHNYYRPPAMLVRLYHDATTAEVVSYQNQRYIRVLYPEDEAPRYYPDEKEQVNLFLADWLMLCLDAGLGRPGRGQPPVSLLQASA